MFSIRKIPSRPDLLGNDAANQSIFLAEPAMYVALVILVLLLAGILLYQGVQNKRPGKIVSAGLLAAGLAGFYGLVEFWGEMLWFDAAGYGSRFWTEIQVQIGAALGGALLAAGAVYLLTIPLTRRARPADYWAEAVAAVLGVMWGLGSWQVILRWLHGGATATADPILGMDTGFYLFTLPFLDALYGLALILGCLAALRLIASIVRLQEDEGVRVELPRESSLQTPKVLYASVGILLLLFGVKQFLDVFQLMYSSAGVVTGPGWTDVMIRLPALLGLGSLVTLCGLAMLLPPTRAALDKRLHQGWLSRRFGPSAGVAGPSAALLGVWIVAAGVAPALVQWLYVEPNEITVERPYIEHNIAFTRQAFALDEVEDRPFTAAGEFTAATIEQNQDLLHEVRLWDWRALNAVYDQFQEIRLYYEFPDVDIDRYHINGAYREVMVAAREMEQDNLPAGSDTFVNKRFKYTHGYGLTLNPVSEFTEGGLPNLLIKDIPPAAQHESLQVKRPEIPGYRARIRPIVSRITIHWPSFYNVVTGKTLALPNLIALQHIPLSPAGVIAKRPAPIALPNSCAAEWRMAPDAVFSPYASVWYFTPHMVHSQYNLL